MAAKRVFTGKQSPGIPDTSPRPPVSACGTEVQGGGCGVRKRNRIPLLQTTLTALCAGTWAGLSPQLRVHGLGGGGGQSDAAGTRRGKSHSRDTEKILDEPREGRD